MSKAAFVVLFLDNLQAILFWIVLFFITRIVLKITGAGKTLNESILCDVEKLKKVTAEFKSTVAKPSEDNSSQEKAKAIKDSVDDKTLYHRQSHILHNMKVCIEKLHKHIRVYNFDFPNNPEVSMLISAIGSLKNDYTVLAEQCESRNAELMAESVDNINSIVDKMKTYMSNLVIGNYSRK